MGGRERARLWAWVKEAGQGWAALAACPWPATKSDWDRKLLCFSFKSAPPPACCSAARLGPPTSACAWEHNASLQRWGTALLYTHVMAEGAAGRPGQAEAAVLWVGWEGWMHGWPLPPAPWAHELCFPMQLPHLVLSNTMRLLQPCSNPAGLLDTGSVCPPAGRRDVGCRAVRVQHGRLSGQLPGRWGGVGASADCAAAESACSTF